MCMRVCSFVCIYIGLIFFLGTGGEESIGQSWVNPADTGLVSVTMFDEENLPWNGKKHGLALSLSLSLPPPCSHGLFLPPPPPLAHMHTHIPTHILSFARSLSLARTCARTHTNSLSFSCWSQKVRSLAFFGNTNGV